MKPNEIEIFLLYGSQTALKADKCKTLRLCLRTLNDIANYRLK